MSRTTKEQAKAYKQTLIDCLRLRGDSGSNAFQRACMLVNVFNDRDFRADHSQYDDGKLADELDQYVDDLALSFLQLKALLERFPEESDWAQGRLNKMYAELLEELREQRSKARDNEDKPIVERLTKKDFSNLREQLHRAEVRVGETSLRAETAENEVASLRAENAALKTKVSRLEGRIEELERRGRS